MREGKTRRRAVIRTVVVGGVLITAAAVALYTPWLGVFGLRRITVSGNRWVSAEAIGRAADLRQGQPLLGISRSVVASRVGTLPWIKEAFVERVFPMGLRIHVVEREPVAWIETSQAGCLTVGEGGVIVEDGCLEPRPPIELLGAARAGDEPGARLSNESVSDLIEALRTGSISDLHIRRIDVSDLSSVVLQGESGIRVLLGRIESHARRVEALAALSREIDVDRYASIDLRLEGEATLVRW